MKFVISIISFALLCTSSGITVTAQSVPDGESFVMLDIVMEEGKLDLTTEKIIAFKDGYCLIVKKAVGITDSSGKLYMTELPEKAVLGSFWALPVDGSFKSMTAETVTAEEVYIKNELCMETIDILKQNEGKTCKVVMKNKEQFEGKITAVLAREYDKIHDSGEDDPDTVETKKALHGAFFVLNSKDRDIVLSIYEIDYLAIKSIKLEKESTIKKTTNEKRLTFQFDEKNTLKEIYIFYYTPGIHWIPTYRVSLDSKSGKADISLQAEIINNLENFENAKLDLVVGVPNFKFKNNLSALTLEQTLTNVLRNSDPHLSSQVNMLSNAIMTQRVAEDNSYINIGDNSLSATVPGGLNATANHDLFVYHLEDISLNKGARAAIPIFDIIVPYKDIYTLNINKQHDFYAGEDTSVVKTADHKIWHVIELENNSSYPWTTGTALIMDGFQPLAQDLMTYTSIKNKVRIPVTIATDVQVTYSESETNREEKAKRFYNYYYCKVDKTGSFEVLNYKDKKIDLEITINIGGRATYASKGSIILDSFHPDDWQYFRGNMQLNNHSTVKWKLEVKDKVKKDFKYYYYFEQY